MKPIVIIIIGLAILAGGFLFSVLFLNIPPQDPPDWLIKERIELKKTENLIHTVGFGILAAGVLHALIKKFRKNAS